MPVGEELKQEWAELQHPELFHRYDCLGMTQFGIKTLIFFFDPNYRLSLH